MRLIGSEQVSEILSRGNTDPIARCQTTHYGPGPGFPTQHTNGAGPSEASNPKHGSNDFYHCQAITHNSMRENIAALAGGVCIATSNRGEPETVAMFSAAAGMVDEIRVLTH